MGMVAMSARWPAGLERCLGYGGSKSWGQKANRYSNGVYERAMTGMKTELWQYDSTDAETIFSLLHLRQKRGVAWWHEGAGGEALPISRLLMRCILRLCFIWTALYPFE
jgi:hypothetical protein